MGTAARQFYGLIGDPVDHSLSPYIMDRAFAAHGIAAMYVAVGVTKDGAGESIRGMRTLGFAGANVTYPLKDAVLPFVELVSPAVAAIEAANTLKFTGEGVVAENTDAVGTVAALEVFGGIQPLRKTVLIFGAGGAGRAAAFGLLSAGAASVTFAVRDKGKAKKAIESLRRAFPGKPIELTEIRKLSNGRGAAFDENIIINATPAGMAGFEPNTLADGAMFRGHHVCFDFVYHPRETPFIVAARQQGASTLDGLALLVAQAQAAFYFWTGRHFPVAEMFDATVKHLESSHGEGQGVVSS